MSGNIANDVRRILLKDELNGSVTYRNGEITSENLGKYIEEMNIALKSGAFVADTDLNYGPNKLPYKVFRKSL